MDRFDRHLSSSEAAQRLGVSAKALRLYEQRGLLTPTRSDAGWRAYGPDALERAAEIVALRRLGLGLAQVGRVLDGDVRTLAEVLAALEATLAAEQHERAEALGRVRQLRAELAAGRIPGAAAMIRAADRAPGPAIGLTLPWPWDGERFDFALPPLTYLTGPLGSGKTRLAHALAAAIPGATFVGLDRTGPAAGRLAADAALRGRVDRAVAGAVADGAADGEDLRALLTFLEDEALGALVIDLVEQGLERGTQEALSGRLRRRASVDRPLVVMTRSTAILDLDAVGPGEAILFCPANHARPRQVSPIPGAPGHEALASCLASPEVRARTGRLSAIRHDG